jgi:hypothetical protein
MSHSRSLSLDLSDRLADIEDTLRAHQRMQTGQDSDFYSSDQGT